VGGWTAVPKEKELGLALWAVAVGPLLMRPIIILPDFGVLGVKMITPCFFPSLVAPEPKGGKNKFLS
jgi:hypothetical protein